VSVLDAPLPKLESYAQAIAEMDAVYAELRNYMRLVADDIANEPHSLGNDCRHAECLATRLRKSLERLRVARAREDASDEVKP
jgi:hypothetical protein